MIIITAIFIAIAAFLVGFILGASNEPSVRPIKFRIQKDKESEILQKEYRNFLSYDGSEQE